MKKFSAKKTAKNIQRKGVRNDFFFLKKKKTAKINRKKMEETVGEK